MEQIALNYQGLVQYFSHQNESGNYPSYPTRAEFASFMAGKLDAYCSDPQSIGLESGDETTALSRVGIIIFLLNGGFKTQAEMKAMSVANQKAAIVELNKKYAGLTERRLRPMNEATLLQHALLWYTRFDYTLQGVLEWCISMPENTLGFKPYTKTQIQNMSHEVARNHVISYLARLSGDSHSELQSHPDSAEGNSALIGKLAIAAFILRAKLKTFRELQHIRTMEQRTDVLAMEAYYRTGTAVQFLRGHVPADWHYQRMTAYTDLELVELCRAWFVIDKPHVAYHQVSTAMAHDSHTGDEHVADGAGLDGFWLRYRDQDRTAREQFKSGIRTVRISSTTGGDLRHSGIQFGKNLEQYLDWLANFLIHDAPHDIMTIIDETTGWSDNLQKVYKKILLDKHKLLFQPSEKKAADDGWPTYEDLKRGKWPTIKQMLEKGQRVVLFVPGSDVKEQRYGTPPWRLTCFGQKEDSLISSDAYEYKLQSGAVGEEPSQNTRPPFATVRSPDRFSADRHLYLINHYFYQALTVAGNEIPTSDRNFSEWEVGDLLIEYSSLAWALTKLKPNYLNVDFYDHEVSPTNFLFDTAAALNHPLSAGPLDVEPLVRERKPIEIVRATGLHVGETYVLENCESGPNHSQYALTRRADGMVGIAPMNNSERAQQWKIVYNTPGTGFALVDPDESLGTIALFDPSPDPASDDGYDNNANIQFKTSNITDGGNIATGFSLNDIGDNQYVITKNNLRSHEQPEDFFSQDWSALEVHGGNIHTGNEIVSRWEWNGSDCQKWKFHLVPTPAFSRPTLPHGTHVFPPAPQRSSAAAVLLAPAYGAVLDTTIERGAPLPFVFYEHKHIPFHYSGSGQVLLASTEDGTGKTHVDDFVEIEIFDRNNRHVGEYTFDYSRANQGRITPQEPVDISRHFPGQGNYLITIRFKDLIPAYLGASAFYLVPRP